MCSAVQWRTFQTSEQIVSREVEQVRLEAESIEAGWSQVIWRQAAQYHGMLKKRHEEEAAKAQATNKKRSEIAQNVARERALQGQDAKAAATLKAERAARELLKEEGKGGEMGAKKGGSGKKKK